jgi:hypothetical protein
MPIMPTMIKMPPEVPAPAVVAQASNSKKPKLRLRQKGTTSSPAEVPKKDAKKVQDQANSSPNGLRDDDSSNDQSNRSDDLTGEDYEKLAKLLQVIRSTFKIQYIFVV